MNLDLTPILQPLLDVAGLVVTALVGVYVPRAVAAFEKFANVKFSEEQRQAILGAASTAAGVLETKLDKGVLNHAHIDVVNPNVVREAQAAINAVPAAMAYHNETPESVARIIVGMVDTSAHGDPPAPGAAVPIGPHSVT